jgi:hypothetical protein
MEKDLHLNDERRLFVNRPRARKTLYSLSRASLRCHNSPAKVRDPPSTSQSRSSRYLYRTIPLVPSSSSSTLVLTRGQPLRMIDECVRIDAGRRMGRRAAGSSTASSQNTYRAPRTCPVNLPPHSLFLVDKSTTCDIICLIEPYETHSPLGLACHRIFS